MQSHELALRECMRGVQPPVAFVGSGLSCNCPSWAEFTRRLAANRDCDSLLSTLDADPSYLNDTDAMLRILDECLALFATESELRLFMESVFVQSTGAVPRVFEALVRASFGLFLTTNYDTNIETAYKSNYGRDLPVVLASRPEEALMYMKERLPFVFKIHGCARAGGPFVIGEADYQKVIYGTPDVQSVLHTIFMTHNVVFMGYGHRDPHISNYLAMQKQVLRFGGLSHFTFLTKESRPFDLARHYRHKFGLSCLYVERWGQIEDVLYELAFLQVRDQYDRVRREQRKAYLDFIDGAAGAAWGAILYAHASSDMGRTDECFALWETVEQNAILEKSIQASPAVHLAYRIIVGVMFLRREMSEEAYGEFELAIGIARAESSISRPLRAMALRYAAHFRLWPAHDDYVDHVEAGKLLDEAKELLGDRFGEDKLDLEKTRALLLGESDPSAAASDLVKIADRAERVGYRKNAGWCWFNVGLLLFEHGDLLPDVGTRDAVTRAIAAFEELKHSRGLAECFLLLGKLEIQECKGTDNSAARRWLERGVAYAILGDLIGPKSEGERLLSELR